MARLKIINDVILILLEHLYVWSRHIPFKSVIYKINTPASIGSGGGHIIASVLE